MLTAYPSLTTDEFAEACQVLERKCQDRLDDTDWTSVQWVKSGELRIKQDRRAQQDHETLERSQEDVQNEIDEDDDMNIMIRPVVDNRKRLALEFSIVLSASYEVPVLWFALSSTHLVRLEDLQQIYADIVAPDARGALQKTGVTGGISIAHHPMTDMPMFFIHPCNTPNAMSTINNGRELDPFQYLLLWVGVVGMAVGLHVPSQILE